MINILSHHFKILNNITLYICIIKYNKIKSNFVELSVRMWHRSNYKLSKNTYASDIWYHKCIYGFYASECDNWIKCFWTINYQKSL